jgi:hypothetical protein
MFCWRLSGAVVERLIEAMKMSLKISRSLNKIDQGIESPPASITLLKRCRRRGCFKKHTLKDSRWSKMDDKQ